MKIKQFVEGRIAQIDQEYNNTNDSITKLNLSTTRTSFANVPLILFRS